MVGLSALYPIGDRRLVILLVVVRPAIRQLSGGAKSTDVVVPEQVFPSPDETPVDMESSVTSVEALSRESEASTSVMTAQAVNAGGGLSSVVANGDLPELPSPETGLEAQSSYLQMLSEKEPERVAHVVKQWITPKDDN